MRNAAICFLALLGLGQSAYAQTQCPAPPPSELSLDYAAFDQADWRALIFSGCADAAIARIEAYRTANAEVLTPEQMRELHFHAGQALAMNGREDESVVYFAQARGGDAEWAAYVDATYAFVTRDPDSVREARARYAAAPNMSTARLGFIDGFIACSAESYMQAVHCASAH